MSATIETALFQGYFNQCPLVQIPGRNFDVDIRYLKEADAGPSFVVLAANVVMHIHKNGDRGDILVFLPGEDEIEQLCRLVRKYAQDLDVNWKPEGDRVNQHRGDKPNDTGVGLRRRLRAVEAINV